MDNLGVLADNPGIIIVIAAASLGIPILLAKFNVAFAGLVYGAFGALGIAIPTSISKKTWEGLGMDAHAPTASDKGLESLERLLEGANVALQSGDLENASSIGDLFVARAKLQNEKEKANAALAK